VSFEKTLYPEYYNTYRLYLRSPEITDAGEIAALRSDPEINKYLKRPENTSLDEAKAHIQKLQQGIKDNGWYYWLLILKATDELIGNICLWNIDRENGSIELGYELSVCHQGKGLMQEAVVKIIEIAFQHLGYKKLRAFTHPENIKSINLLERNGFIQYANPEIYADGGNPDLYFCLANPSAF
jgi:ribosomal-protein-alanine N-acetyltransferase